MEPACSGGLYATLRILLPAVLAGLRYLFKSHASKPAGLQPGAVAEETDHSISECGCPDNHPSRSTPNHTEPMR